MTHESVDELLIRLVARVRGSEPRLGPVRLVCIDGPAGSGKTTLANRLGAELDAPVLHVDDLLEGWGGLAGMWPRLQEGVLDPLAAGRPGRYRRYDWVAGEFAEPHDVPVAGVLILEGCGSARRAADGAAVLRVWVEAPAEARLTRGLARDGEAMRPRWLAWMRDEDAHFAAESTRARADVIVDAGGWRPIGSNSVPDREWYRRDVLEVAPALLGAYVTTAADAGSVTLRLTEVEAYRGGQDPGSHAFRGRTARNAAMFGEPGRLYVYRHLGLHTCINIVCGPAGGAGAVLLRAGEVVEGAGLARDRRTRAGVVRSDAQLASGPARLAVALGLDLDAYGADVTDPGGAVVVHRPRAAAPAGAASPAGAVATGPRVGVSGDGGDGEAFPWRFWLAADPTVSAYRPAHRRAHGRLAPTPPDPRGGAQTRRPT